MLSSKKALFSTRRGAVAPRSAWSIPDLVARARTAELDLVEAEVIEPKLKQELRLWARIRWYRLERRRRVTGAVNADGQYRAIGR